MKNNKSLFLLAGLLAVTALTGCNNKKEEPQEITDEMITNIIEASNPDVEVHVGEYESMIKDETFSEEDYHTFTSSSVLDAPRDYVITVNYDNSDNLSAQNVTNLMSNIVNANDQANIITITDRGGNYQNNCHLTLSTSGDSFTVTRPGGYDYGEVYKIAINDTPHLIFDGKSSSIRTITLEIEDDPSEPSVIEDKVLKDDIVNIDLDKVSNKQVDTEKEIYSFDYDGNINLNKGQIFYATRTSGPNKYLDFYGEYQETQDIGNKKRIIYTAPDMDQIYNSFHLKDNKPLNLDECDTELLLTQEVATEQFKKSSITRALVRTALPYANNDLEIVGGMLSNFRVRFDTNYYNNRVGFKMMAGIYGYELANKTYLTFELGYEKVTDYNVDFDVGIKYKWILPVGVDYKIKCLEECDSAYYVKVYVTQSWAPDVPVGPDDEKDADFFNTLADNIEKIENGIEVYDGREMGPSTSGTRTSWPIIQVDCYYFAPVTFRLKLEVYIDIGLQATGLFKKQVHTNRVDFCFTNESGAETDEENKTAETSNWMVAVIGALHLEVGVRATFNFSILGLYDYLLAQAYAEGFVNASVSGMAVANITTREIGTDFTGYLCLDFAISVGVRVGLYFKILCFDKNISKLLFFDYLFRMLNENALEHWSTLCEDTVTIDDGQTLSLDQTNVLWVEYFDSVTMQLREKKYAADAEYHIFSGYIVPDFVKDMGQGKIFTYKSNNESLLTVDKDGVIHVKDGTPNEFTTTIKISVSNWAGTISDKTITVNFKANDTKELYCGAMYIGNYRPGYEVVLPEGPKEYGKCFLYYNYGGTHYNVGDKFVMPNGTTNLEPVYRLLKYFTVRFFDGLGNCISDNRIMEFEAAIEPSERMRDRYMIYEGNYVFLGWDTKFDYITGDLDVHAIYMEVK